MSKNTFKKIIADGWVYRGEGNANLVVAIPKRRQVLRIQKTKRPTSFLAWVWHWLSQFFEWHRRKNDKLQIEFYNSIMVPLVGRAYVNPGISVRANYKQICQLDEELMIYRPEHRKHQQLQSGTATLFDDYTFLPRELDVDNDELTFAVEIKPKQGWIPMPDRSRYHCQFCLNQYLKLKRGQIKEVSSYCPLDLFSGDPQRMVYAIKGLVFNPQNNFKIFTNGICAYEENSSLKLFYELLNPVFRSHNFNELLEEFSQLMVRSLLKEFPESKNCNNCDNAILPRNVNYRSKCNFTRKQLPPESVLAKLLALQMLNCIGLQKYYEMYKAIGRKRQWTYLNGILQVKTCPKCFICDCANKADEVLASGKYYEADLLPYLIACVAYDCSLMITFKKIATMERSTEKLEDYRTVVVKRKKFLINIGIIDLFPKPASTVTKHVKRNIEVETAYILINNLPVDNTVTSD